MGFYKLIFITYHTVFIIGVLFATEIYIDNGLDQSIIESMTSMEKDLLTEKIFEIHDLSLKKNKNLTFKPEQARSAPQYLINIYNIEQKKYKPKQHGQFTNSQQFYLSANYKKSDTIISFAIKNSHWHNNKPQYINKITFDITTMAHKDILLSAELQLYKNAETNNLQAYQVSVYRISRTIIGEEKYYFAKGTTVMARDYGWMILDITTTLQYWLKNPNDNYGLLITASTGMSITQINYQPEDIGFVGFNGNAEKQPFMAAFYKYKKENQLDINLNNLFNRYKRCPAMSNLNKIFKRNSRTQQTDAESCGLRKMYVSFADIKWPYQVIVPKGYNAYYCNGECNYPMTTGIETTMHSIVQALMHQLNNTVPLPCCAPTKYLPVSLLYFLDEYNTALKHYPNMIVTGCGCL